METGIPARLSLQEARRFGLLVGAVFLLFGSLLWWRGSPVAGAGLSGLGACLIALGAIRPAMLRPVYRAWMGLALVISKVTTPILLGAVYFLVITPIGVLRRLAGHDLRQPRRGGSSSWTVLDNRGRQRADLERQF